MNETLVWAIVGVCNTVCAIAGAMFAVNRNMHPGYGVLLGGGLNLLGLAILICLPMRPAPTTPILELADLDAACPACQHRIVAPASQAGLRVKCPRCRAVVQLPTSGAAR